MAPEKARGNVETVEPTTLERAFAQRVAESKATIPHVEIEVEAEVPELRVTEEIVSAAARALREFPRVNGFYRDGRFELYSRVNVQVAVTVDHTLLHPTIFDADSKDAETIAAELSGLAERARSGAITQPELSGGTFTVVDLGVFEIARGSAAIQRGQAAILTAGRIRGGGAVTLSLACDNRILQGDYAAGFLLRVAELLAVPT